MVITNEVKYAKKFLSRTEHNDISHHGSPIWEPYQTMGKEDEELREEILSKFALKREVRVNQGGGLGSFYTISQPEGCDGKFFYTFNFYSELKSAKTEENVPYFSGVAIKKAGKLENLSDKCDLEDFLLEKGFKKKH